MTYEINQSNKAAGPKSTNQQFAKAGRLKRLYTYKLLQELTQDRIFWMPFPTKMDLRTSNTLIKTEFL